MLEKKCDYRLDDGKCHSENAKDEIRCDGYNMPEKCPLMEGLMDLYAKESLEHPL